MSKIEFDLTPEEAEGLRSLIRLGYSSYMDGVSMLGVPPVRGGDVPAAYGKIDVALVRYLNGAERGNGVRQ